MSHVFASSTDSVAHRCSWFLMDRAGRRPILLLGAGAMAVFLTLTGYWIYIDQAYTPNAGMSPPSRRIRGST